MKKILAAIGVISLLFAGCSQTASSDDSDQDLLYSIFPLLENIDNEYEAELYFNYTLLDLYYIYGLERNEISSDYKVYLNKGTSADARTKGFCTNNYYDVCYMYNQLADPFTRYFDPKIAPQVLASIFET